MKKLDMHSPNLVAKNIDRLAELFPNCLTEAADEEGRLVRRIDFDLLRQELDGALVEGPTERFRLDWPGKRQALLTANAPIAKTLRPDRDSSVNFDSTRNIYIEGDNLDALKLLQENYLGKVKMIYIDPPYNTGHDFIYEDDFAEDSGEYLLRSNQKDEEGNRLTANTEANGRFHSDWLSMMYSRLKLARNLLRDDGVIFISIDDNESATLRKLCDEVFGEGNFLAAITWHKKRGKDNSAKFFSITHEVLLVYSREINLCEIKRLPLDEETIKAYKNPDNDHRGKYRLLGIWSRQQGGSLYDYTSNAGKYYSERLWLVKKERMAELDNDNRLVETNDNIYYKKFLSENIGSIPETIWIDCSNNANAKDEIKCIFNQDAVFDTAKPIPFIQRMIKVSTNDDDIILDFFSGSATTAHALMQLNAKDGGNRRFIMVQLPEETDEKSEAFKAGYKTIADIGRERIRRAGNKILEDQYHESWNRDIGFRSFKIDSSNMADVYYTPDDTAQDKLAELVDNIKPGRTEEDLLFQVMLDWGLDLSLPLKRRTVAGAEVFEVDHNALAACFADQIGEALVTELACRQPPFLRVVFRDSSFRSDSDKINVEQIFKQLSPATEVKVI